MFLRDGRAFSACASATLVTALVACLLAAAAQANPTNGMIDGSYAKMMPSYYLQKHLRPGVRRVCVDVTGTTARLAGVVKTQDHSGTWTVRRTVLLLADSGTHEPPPTPPDDDIASWMSTNSWWNHNRHPADHPDTPHAVNPRGGRENCDFYVADDPGRPVNWCGMRRSIKPAHGWTGHLKSDASELRVQVRDHVLNMPGRVGLSYNSTCP